MIKKVSVFIVLILMFLSILFEVSADTGRIARSTGSAVENTNEEYAHFEWFNSKGICFVDKKMSTGEGYNKFTSDQKKNCCTAVGENVSVAFCVGSKCTGKIVSRCTQCDLGCAPGYTCSKGKCVVPCSDECAIKDSKECSAGGFRTCGQFDSDNCLEWSDIFACDSGKVCSNGQCVVKAITPVVQPTIVQPTTPVVQPTVQTCTDSDNGKDYYLKGKGVGLYSNNKQKGWVFGGDLNKVSSRYDPAVDYSIYYDHCFNSATSNQLNEGYCDNNGLLSSTSYLCPNGCKDGTCVAQPITPSSTISTPTATCTDECNLGAVVFSEGGNYKLCGNYDLDKCLEWTSLCVNQCAKAGEKICSSGSDNSYATCGNYDADSCLEWSSVTSCSSGYTCSNGQCVVQPVSPVNPSIVQTCTDSDNGKDYYVKGSITAKNIPGTVYSDNSPSTSIYSTNSVLDACHGMDLGNGVFSELDELYCDNTIDVAMVTHLSCRNGCKDGACIV